MPRIESAERELDRHLPVDVSLFSWGAELIRVHIHAFALAIILISFYATARNWVPSSVEQEA
jgi:hypothetical protein